MAVARPKSTEDVAFIAKICTAFKIPMSEYSELCLARRLSRSGCCTH